MKRFTCANCGNEVHFENTACVACGAALAYDPAADRMLSHPERGQLRLCANVQAASCNWLAEDGARTCLSCARTRTIPDQTVEGNAQRWARLELAKRHLFRSLLRLGLQFPAKAEDERRGLAFDFLAAVSGPVTTGHAGGVITIDVAEADDAERASRRENLGERYRTLLGHMRHEIAHYFWERLVEDPGLQDDFRQVFGDERENYPAALERHYAGGPPAGWQDGFVSAYATAHPWEDFAESWAHYLHIVDGLETARAYGIAPTISPAGGSAATIEADPYGAAGFDTLMADFVPLTVAMNAINRSLGQPDFYPFVLSQPAIAKLGFVHALAHGRS